MDAVATLLLLVAPYVLFAAIDRFLPGGDRPFSLFLPPAELPWPRGLQEEDTPRWTFDVVEERATRGRSERSARPRIAEIDVRGPMAGDRVS